MQIQYRAKKNTARKLYFKSAPQVGLEPTT